jgi:hypothetical protein
MWSLCSRPGESNLDKSPVYGALVARLGLWATAVSRVPTKATHSVKKRKNRRRALRDVWRFRWREPEVEGRKIHRRIVLGTAEDLKSIASAGKMVVGFGREVSNNVRFSYRP